MATIRYTKTYFSEPGRISEEMYLNLKRELNKNPHFKIDPNPETFTDRHKGLLMTIAICAGLFVLGLIFTANMRGDDSSIWNPIMGLSMLILIGSVIRLFLEGPSFATYIKQKEEYFSRMKFAIQNTSSYIEFVSMFYK